ncbi:Cobalt-precorrin-5A hydrolase [BD1-7 clade bacterium]|uniref:Cobalt-precorrin-5A hydrolase n=1 Tax=BD1-7 clade bacterium TaxID=2029982 RepID=A0A5S9PCE2_9GAMM|nr:Cobalt-precorrin-5A hydrolase [BD1-7 clade bacterium]CAA0102146.1 Cobalt-precorrin-5A hydrolase [BD1-7 clade bacterium]
MVVHIYTLTDVGYSLGQSIQAHLIDAGQDAEVFLRPRPFKVTVQQAFSAGHRLIMICATGIVMRTLAPVLKDKYQDPAVLVLDEHGEFVIPLLSGHEGGANEFGRRIADALGAQLVQTTAASYTQPVYAVGMGCERHCPVEFLQDVLTDCLAVAGIEKNDISAIASIDIKSDEKALIALAQMLEVPFICYPAEQLHPYENQLSQRSDYIFKTVGVYGVAESAALAVVNNATEQPAELVVPKRKNAKATCAVARSYPTKAHPSS